jgi:MoxR-like ATPase
MVDVQDTCRKIRQNIAKVIVGKEDVIDLCLVALLCEGHILFEDVPGIGKTTLAKALARSTGCSFKRIQFTPDLLPGDVTGIYYFNQKSQEFEFRPGPIISQFVLADEINRATPRTQSALLEAMQERQITVDVETTSLPRPFMVLATQNPIELEGTFPLPEAQVDRFMMKLALGYPAEEDENTILIRYKEDDPLETLHPVVEASVLLTMQAQVKSILVEESVQNYAVRVVRATREHDAVELGVSPRGTLALYKAAQALAALRGRGFVLPDDIKYLAPSLLTHRIIISPQTRLRGRRPEEVVMEVVETVPVPVET